MSWKNYYQSKVMTVGDAAKLIRSGDRFWTPLCLGQPTNLIMDAVVDRKGEIKDVEYNFALILNLTRYFSRIS